MHIQLPSSFRSLTTLLAILLAFAGGGDLAAQVLLPDPAPTIITAVPYTITKAGFYQLGGNFVSTVNSGSMITINADNVTLDFNGHSLTGPADPSSALYGIYALDHNNITIQNGKVAFCNVGISLVGSNPENPNNLNQRVLNMLVTHCFYIGLDIYNVLNADVLNSRFCFIGGSANAAYSYGIYAGGSGLKIGNNEFCSIVTGAEGAGTGTGISAGAGVFAIGNTFDHCDVTVHGGKYANNLTNPTNAPTGGIDAGGNN